MAKEIKTFLDELTNLYGEFEVFVLSENYKSKWVKWLEAREDDKFVDKINNRTILDVEVVLDLEEPDKFNGLINRLNSDGLFYSAFKTGSRGYHIHLIFFELRAKSPAERRQFKEQLIKKYGCDMQKAAGKCGIALEYAPHWKSGNLKSLVCEREGTNLIQNVLIEKEEEPFKKEFESIKSLGTYLKEGVPEQKWICHPFVLERGITIFGGIAGAKKTWGGMQLALACAEGKSFLNQYECKKVNVLYVDEENGFITILNRFKRLVKGHQYQEDIQNLQLSICNNVKLDDPACFLLFREIVRRFNPELIIIDSMVRCMQGEEDKANDVRMIFDNLKPLLEEGKSFVLLHHTTKADGKSMLGLRGSGDFAAFADVICMFSNGQEGFCNVEIVKNRHIALDESCSFFIQLEDKEDEAICLEWRGQKDDKGDVNQRCADEIEEWVKSEKLESFTAQSAFSYAKHKAFKKNCVFNALKILIADEKVFKAKRGCYKVNTNLITFLEENLGS